MHQIRPTSAYLRILKKVPENLKNYNLVLIHYNSDEFVCDRWTTRTRDIIRKKAKMLQFDMCEAYLMEPSRFEQFILQLYQNEYNDKAFMFLAYELCGSNWHSTVRQFSYKDVCSIEYYSSTGEYNGLSHWKVP